MPEPTTSALPSLPRLQPSFGKRYRTIIKLVAVGLLILLLLIPLEMITGVLSDRLNRRNEAVADITSSWGKEQCIVGPVLMIPYQYRFKTIKEVPGKDGKVEKREVEETAGAWAYFLPETLNITGDVQTQMLHRGIYDAVVFRAQVTIAGKFAPPDWAYFKIDIKDLQWKDSLLAIAVTDLRGTREALVLDWGGTKRPMLPGSQVPGYTTGATALLALDKPITSAVEFSIPLDVNGSGGIFFAPFGVENETNLKSNWPDPGFRGAFLPADRSVRADGSMRNGKFRTTAVIIRNIGRAKPATSALPPRPSRNQCSARSSCRSWTLIATSSARSITVCFFSCSCSPRFSFLKSLRGKKFIRSNI